MRRQCALWAARVVAGAALLLFAGRALVAEEAYEATGKAWKAKAKRDWNEVIRLADHAERKWGAKARELNAGLDDYPKGQAARNYAVLNELATITLLKAGALKEKGDKAGALAAYRKIVEDYTYGQCWDNKGWWWQPAKSARDSISTLAPGTVAEVTVKAPALKPELRLPGKRGVCFPMRNPASEQAKKRGGTWEQNVGKIKALKPYWNYSWGMGLAPVQPTNVEFIPMAWGAWGEERLRGDIEKLALPHIRSGRVKRFLGFNEPDKDEQANMPYAEALKYWPVLEELNVPLCSPACANPLGKDDDSSAQGVKGTWMRDFMVEVDKRGYRVDYIGAHWYGGTSATAFKEQMVRIHEKYGKRPLLITEFAPADWAAKTPAQNRHSRAAVLAFMKDVLPWIESQNWIAGYAWFSFGPNSPQGASSALFDANGKLTVCGQYYRTITNENPQGDQRIVVSKP